MKTISFNTRRPALIATLLATTFATPARTKADNISTAHLSLLYKPSERMTVGAELIYGRREIVNGASDDATRLRTSVQFNF